nr:hypothetical protein [uncultured Carboxylicivirga sp.]
MRHIRVWGIVLTLFIIASCNSRNYLPPVDPFVPDIFDNDSLSQVLIQHILEQINELSRKAEDIAYLMEDSDVRDMDQLKGLGKVRLMKNFTQMMLILKEFGEGMDEYKKSPSIELAVGDTLNAIDFLMNTMALRMMEIQRKYPHLKGLLNSNSTQSSDSTHLVMDFGF